MKQQPTMASIIGGVNPSDKKLMAKRQQHKVNDTKRCRLNACPVSWMRKPEYISTEKSRYQPTTTTDKFESKVGRALQKKLGAKYNTYMDRKSKIVAIEKTFKDAKHLLNSIIMLRKKGSTQRKFCH